MCDYASLHVQVERTGEATSRNKWVCEIRAFNNTWSHQRRKRRLARLKEKQRLENNNAADIPKMLNFYRSWQERSNYDATHITSIKPITASN